MITIGAAIDDETRARETADLLEAKAMGEYLDESRHLKIGVPPLTLKEKASLDQLMPRPDAPTADEVSALGFRLKPAQIEAYHRFYRHYPMFGEFAV